LQKDLISDQVLRVLNRKKKRATDQKTAKKRKKEVKKMH
jgi:hypothetical protein